MTFESGTPHTVSGRQTPGSTPSLQGKGLNTSSKVTTLGQAGLPMSKTPILEEPQDEKAIELPADVPEDALRNAPVSIKNRLSMTLGLKPKDNADHRISSIYYPKALGDLLRIPQSPKFKASPQIVAARNTAVRSNSPLAESDGDYFSAHERSPEIGLVAPVIKEASHLNVVEAEESNPRVSVPSPGGVQDNTQYHLSALNPGLNSHNAVMSMASPPVELPARDESPGLFEEERPASRSRKQSESSLGEPGPEIAETGSGEIFRQADVQVSAKDDPAVLHEVGTESGPRSLGFHSTERSDKIRDNATKVAGRAEHIEQSNVESTPLDLSQQEAAVGKKKEESGLQSSNSTSRGHDQAVNASQAADSYGNASSSTVNSEELLDDTIDRPANEDTITTFIAELEAVVPQKSPQPVTHQPVSPIELEAPVQTFVLPPRSKAKLTQGKDWASATIKDRVDFFKLPNEQNAKPGMKPKDFRGTRTEDPGPVRPLKLKLQKHEGKLVPVQVHTPPKDASDSPRTSRLGQDVIAKLIDQMSNTPPGSPIHVRDDSSTSSNSAQIRTKTPSLPIRHFGPPESAPAPPGPGGRPMVSPDYASRGQFEGERKHTGRGGSRTSKTSLKDILTGGSARNSSESSARSLGHSSRVQSLSARGSGTDTMLTSAGKDVLWFKEEGNASLNANSNAKPNANTPVGVNTS
jgi:hypothetical protein